MRCWLCGVEPEEVYDICSMEHQGAVARVARWPAPIDHEHRPDPPTPEDLAEGGSATLSRIQSAWLA